MKNKTFKPVTLTLNITSEEQGVALWHKLNATCLMIKKWSTTTLPSDEFIAYANDYCPKGMTVNDFWLLVRKDHGLWIQVDQQLENKNLYVKSWQPGPPPIKIGEYTVQFLGDKVRVGCTEVTKEQLKEILNRLE